MVSLVITAVVLFVLPLVLLYFFSSNAGIMYLAACAGLVLLSSLDPAVVTTAGAVVPGEGVAYVRLSVVLLSMALAALMFRGTVHGSLLYLHFFIIVFMAGTLWALLPGVTGVSWLVDSTAEPQWQTVDDFKSLIIGAGFASSLLAIVTRSKKH